MSVKHLTEVDYGVPFGVARLDANGQLDISQLPKDINVLKVEKHPSIGDFSSINNALSSITDNSGTNFYVISVGPGIFYENKINCKPYVSIIGSGIETTIIKPNGNHDLFVITDIFTELSFMSLQDCTSGKVAIFINDCGDYAQCHKINFVNCDINIKVISLTKDTYFYGEYIDYNGNYSIGTEIISNNGFISYCNAENYYNLPSSGSLYHNIISGTNASMDILASGNIGIGSDIFALIENNAMLNITSTYVNNVDKGIYITNGGKAHISGTIFENNNLAIYSDTIGYGSDLRITAEFINCTNNILIDNSTTIGFFNGFTEYTKTHINRNSTFFITNKDLKIITVAKKGGDFSSVNDAINIITDNSDLNRYTIEVGPGIYIEPTFTIPAFVSLVGKERDQVILMPQNPNSTFIQVDKETSIKNINIKGSTSGVGLSINNTQFDPLTPMFQIRDCVFEDCDICIKAMATISRCEAFIRDVNFRGVFTYGLLIDGTSLTSVDTVEINHTGLYFEIASDNVTCIKSTGIFAEMSCSNLLVDGNGYDNLTGVYTTDGSKTTIISSEITGAENGIIVPNSGSASDIRLLAVTFRESGTYDINIQHPQTFGVINVTATKTKVFIDDNSPISIDYTDPTINGSVIIGNIFAGFNNSKSTNILPSIEHGATLGILSGGELYNISGTTISCTSGKGYLKVGVFPNDYLKYIEFEEQILTLTNNTTNYIFINSSGILQSSLSVVSGFFEILLGVVRTNQNDIVYIQNIQIDAYHTSRKLDRMIRLGIGPIYKSGSIVSKNGFLQLDVTSGDYYHSTHEFKPSGGTAILWKAFYRNGLGNYFVVNQNTIDYNHYDLGTGGLTLLDNNKFARHALYIVNGPDETYLLSYGQVQYNTLNNAIAGTISNPPNSANIALIASIIVQNTSTSGSKIQQIRDERPTLGFKASGISTSSNHGDLSGLGNDDHPQYLLVNGIRSMAGNLNMGANAITNVGTVDGVIVSAHASRHNFNGVDPLTPALGSDLSAISDSTNSAGVNNTKIPRADHVHAHGNRGRGSLHAIAINGTAGFMSVADKSKLDGFATGVTLLVQGTSNRVSVSGGTQDLSANRTWTVDIDSNYVGQSSIITLGNISTGTWNGSTITAFKGGTDQTSYTIGDILYASGSSALSKLADVTTGNVLISGGVGIAPSYGKVGLTTHVSGILPVANGGTGVNNFGGTNSIIFTTTPNVLSKINTTNNGILITSSLGVPSISTIIPNATQDNITRLGTIISGIWNGTVIGNSFITNTFSSKILDNTNTITLKDNLFTLQDDVDTTKQMIFQLSGISSSSIRTLTVPNNSGTIALTSDIQNESTTAGNGLTMVGQKVTLGGTLTQNTNLNLSTFNLLVKDVNNKNIVDFKNRSLFDTSGSTAIDWRGRKLYDPSHKTTIQWVSRTAYDSTESQSIDWNNRFLTNSSGDNTVLWNNKTLNDSLGVIVDWNNKFLNDGSLILSLDWTNRKLYSTSGVTLVDWQSGKLEGFYTPTGKWDLTNKKYVDAQVAASAKAINGLSVISGSVGLGGTLIQNTTISQGAFSLLVKDANTKTIADFKQLNLNDTTGKVSIDWQGRNLYDGTSKVSVDYLNRILKDSTNINSVNWATRKLYSTSGITLVDWQSGKLEGFYTPTGKWDLTNKKYVDDSGSNSVQGSRTLTVSGTTNRVSVSGGTQNLFTNRTWVVDIDSNYVGQSSIITLGNISTGTWNGSTITAFKGGTGQTSYTTGDLLYASGSAALSKLADVATGNALISGGVGVAPAWGKIDLTTHVSGILPVANGGTGVNNFNVNEKAINGLSVISGSTGLGGTLIQNSNLNLSTFNFLFKDVNTKTIEDFKNRSLNDTSGLVSVDWRGRSLIDLTQKKSIDWQNRKLYSTSGVSLVDWQSGKLEGFYTPTGKWDLTTKKYVDDSGSNSVQGSRTLLVQGTSNRVSVSGGTQNLFANRTWIVDIDNNYSGQNSIITLGNISTGTWNGSTITAFKGGTGQTTYTVGDILYASGSAALSKLADVATGNALISGGISTAPSWGKIGLTTHVSGILPISNGGTGINNFNIAGTAINGLSVISGSVGLGGTLIQNTTIKESSFSLLINNANNKTVTNFKQLNLNDTTGKVSIDWQGRNLYDNTSKVSVDYLNRYLKDSTNITSLDWQNRKLYSTSGVTLVDWQSGKLEGFYTPTGKWDLTNKKYVDDSGSNSVQSSRTLTVSGTSNRISVLGGTQNLFSNRTWTVDIDVAYVGQTSIITLGNISTGTWNGSTITAFKGGTGQTSYAVGDILYASGSAALSKLADVATGNALISGGVGTAPSYGKIGLTTHVSGILPIANGGTGINNFNVNEKAINGLSVISGSTGLGGNLIQNTTINLVGFNYLISGTSSLAINKNGIFLSTSSGHSVNLRTGKLTVNRTIDFPNNSGTVALTSDLNSYTLTTRTLLVQGTSNRVSVSGGTQDLSANRTWTVDIDSNYIGQSSIITLGNISTGTWNGSTITAFKGGTGQTSYAVGDLLYASGSAALSKLADVATGNALISGGISTAPSWGKIGLTTHVSGILPVANGGSGISSFTLGSVIYAGSSGLSQDNAHLFYDASTRILGIGTTTPTLIDVGGNGLHATGDVRTDQNIILRRNNPNNYVDYSNQGGSSGINYWVGTARSGSTVASPGSFFVWDQTNTIARLVLTNQSKLTLGQTIGTINVDGVIYNNTSDSNTITGTSETNFNTNFTIPANSLNVGTIIKIKAFGKYSTNVVSPNLTIRLKIGSTVLLTTGARGSNNSESNAGFTFEAFIIIRTTGSSGSVSSQLLTLYQEGSTNTNGSIIPSNGTKTWDTTVSQILQFSAQWSSASASNIITIENVEYRTLRA